MRSTRKIISSQKLVLGEGKLRLFYREKDKKLEPYYKLVIEDCLGYIINHYRNVVSESSDIKEKEKYTI